MRHKIFIIAMMMLFLISGTLCAFAQSPYSYEKMENELVEFGDKPWEQDLKQDMEDHIKNVKKDCATSQKKYEKKKKEEKIAKEKVAEEKAAEEKAKKKTEIIVDKDGKWEKIGRRDEHAKKVFPPPVGTFMQTWGTCGMVY